MTIAPGETKKILIVDDNPAMRRTLAAVLSALRVELIECADGADALDAYERHHPDVVVMDIQMRDLDGIAATRAIVGADPAARVVIVTQYDEPDLRAAAARAGACDYVLKENLITLKPLLERLVGLEG
jgi:CheY-like chemotaxis protein